MHARSVFFPSIAVLALGLALAPSDGRCQTFITFASDVTWETFAMNPNGSQGPSLGAPQFPSWAYHSATLYEIPGAAWMWLPGVNESSLSNLQGVYFSKQFDLHAPIGGLFFIAADDFAEVIVNGECDRHCPCQIRPTFPQGHRLRALLGPRNQHPDGSGAERPLWVRRVRSLLHLRPH